jgi:hypothetical protein
MTQPTLPPLQLIVGTRPEVLNALRTAHSHGRLIATGSQLRPVPGDHLGRVYIRARILPPPPARPVTPHRTWRPYLIAVAVAAGLALVALLIWAVVAAVNAAVLAITHALPELLGLLAVAGVLLLFAAGRAGVCPGIHCPGCRHR